MKFKAHLQPGEEHWVNSPVLQVSSRQGVPHSSEWLLPASIMLTKYPWRQKKKKIHRLDCRQSRKKYTSGIQNGKKINSELQNRLVSCHLDSQSLDFGQTCLRPVWNKDTLNCWIITKLNKKATDLVFLYFMQVMVGENAFFSSCM